MFKDITVTGIQLQFGNNLWKAGLNNTFDNVTNGIFMGSNNLIEDFSLQNFYNFSGISLSIGSNNVIRNSDLSAFGTSLRVNSNRNTLDNVTVSQLGSLGGSGIQIPVSSYSNPMSNNVFNEITAYNRTYGLNIWGSNGRQYWDFNVTNSTFKDSDYGLFATTFNYNGFDWNITNNTFWNTTTAISLRSNHRTANAALDNQYRNVTNGILIGDQHVIDGVNMESIANFTGTSILLRSNNVIKDSDLTSRGISLRLAGSNNNVDNVTVSRRGPVGSTGLYIDPIFNPLVNNKINNITAANRTYGVNIWGQFSRTYKNFVIENSTFINSTEGIRGGGSAALLYNLTVRNTTFQNLTTGFLATRSTNTTISTNDFIEVTGTEVSVQDIFDADNNYWESLTCTCTGGTFCDEDKAFTGGTDFEPYCAPVN